MKYGITIPFRFHRITRRQGGGEEAYFTYVEEADDAPGIRRAALPTKLAKESEVVLYVSGKDIFRYRVKLIYFHAFGKQIQPGFGVADEFFRALDRIFNSIVFLNKT